MIVEVQRTILCVAEYVLKTSFFLSLICLILQRHGAFIIKEQKSQEKPMERADTIASGKNERPSSMWDLLHPKEDVLGQRPHNPYKYRRPLPQIKRTPDYGQVWQTAPYANDFQFNPHLSQPSAVKEIHFDQ